MTYLWFKLLHVFAVVAWMSGLFYVGRIIVNHVEALARPEPARSLLAEHLGGMGRRAYRGIVTQGAVLAIAGAVGLLAAQPALVHAGWLQAKLLLVAGLVGYHLYCGRLLGTLRSGRAPVGPLAARLLNEVPTIFLLTIALLAVFKTAATPRIFLQATVGLLAVLVAGVFGYARVRARSRPGAVRPSAAASPLASP